MKKLSLLMIATAMSCLAGFAQEDPWKEVYANPLCGTSADDFDSTPVDHSPNGSYQIQITTSIASGTVLEGCPVGWAFTSAWKDNYLQLGIDVEEKGTYKFQYRGRFENSDFNYNPYLTAQLYYAKDGYGEQVASEKDYRFEHSDVLPGELMESVELKLEPGKYQFGIKILSSEYCALENFFIGDFKLLMLDEAAVPKCTISWEESEMGEVIVTEDGKRLENNAEVLPGTEVIISAEAADGYELTSLYVNDKFFINGTKYTVNEDVTIVPTFEATAPEQYEVSWSGDNCTIEVVLADDPTTVLTNGGSVDEGTVIKVNVTPADGFTVESIKANGQDLDEDNTWTVNGATEITVVTSSTGIAQVAAAAMTYDAASETLRVDGKCAVKVYDITGRAVMDTVADGVCNVSSLKDGIYIAVVDGKALKFRK